MTPTATAARANATLRGRVPWRGLLLCVVMCVLAGCGGEHHRRTPVISPSLRTAPPVPTVQEAAPAGIEKIRHVVMIVQENRSFDSYFGTYPGADGIPAKDGKFTVCLPDPARGVCDAPFHDSSRVNGGGPHGQGAAANDIHGGRMDAFFRQSETAAGRGCGGFAGVCSPHSRSDARSSAHLLSLTPASGHRPWGRWLSTDQLRPSASHLGELLHPWRSSHLAVARSGFSYRRSRATRSDDIGRPHSATRS